MAKLDSAIRQAALVEYTAQRDKVNAPIATIPKELGLPAVSAGAKPKDHMSAAGRQAIAEAQRKRWAAVHAKAAKKVTPKRKTSAERKAAVVANLVKARAAWAAKGTAARAYTPRPLPDSSPQP